MVCCDICSQEHQFIYTIGTDLEGANICYSCCHRQFRKGSKTPIQVILQFLHNLFIRPENIANNVHRRMCFMRADNKLLMTNDFLKDVTQLHNQLHQFEIKVKYINGSDLSQIYCCYEVKARKITTNEKMIGRMKMLYCFDRDKKLRSMIQY